MTTTSQHVLEHELADQRKRISKRLRQARQMKEMRMLDVANAILDQTPWSVSRVAGYEQGTRAVSTEAALRLSQVLGVTQAWILGLDNTWSETEEEAEFIVAFRAASHTQRQYARMAVGLALK